MDKQPKIDRVLLWLFERKPGESRVKVYLRIAAVVVVGSLAAVSAFRGVLWLAWAW